MMSNWDDWLTVAFILMVTIALAWPLGAFMARVYEGRSTVLDPVVGPVERGIYRFCGVSAQREMRWTTYAFALLLFNLVGTLVVYALQRVQGLLPLNPDGMTGVAPDLSLNTAISFGSNTNWQAYSGETTLAYLTQMLALTTQNFVSAATGMAVLVAMVRGFARRSSSSIGNFWVDLVRSVLYILLPLSVVGGLVLVALGVPQTLDGAAMATGITGTIQRIAMGPVASQLIIKQLGTNGGGYFGVNSAHPFENPNVWTNLVEIVAILLIPVALTFTFGRMLGSIRQGLAIFGAMAVLLVAGLGVTTVAERDGVPMYDGLGVSQATEVHGEPAPGGNMEGKEARFGIPLSSTWAVFTTAASNGSVNSMHDSYTPLGGLVAIANIVTGEVIFGGVGSGLYGMLFYAIVAMFIAGLMVGRTPEYLGKKIEAYEMKMAMIALLIVPILILGLTAVASVTDAGLDPRTNSGPHGLSEILYAYASGAGNNGSAFAGLGVNTGFYNLTIGLAMAFGRYLLIVPALAIAGSLAAKKITPVTAGTLPTTGPLWVGLLAGTVVVVGALTFFPVISLGPIIEHLFASDGVQFAAP